MMVGLMQAVVLLGPGPAALVGATTQVVAWARTRAKPHFMLANVATFAWFPLIASLLFQATVRLMDLGAHGVAYYLVVFVAFVLAMLVNVIAVFGYRRYLYGTSIIHSVREFVLPLMSAHLMTGLLTMGAVFVVVETGTLGIVLTALVLLIFQYLVGELLKSKQRGERAPPRRHHRRADGPRQP